ncbi:MAG TPA: hypothetical protein VFO39_21460 [Candidatus Sulfotelmatobacter sp.]|nr:hypothetical protein [Candidatus Sulfotelmatobacter sp.]
MRSPSATQDRYPYQSELIWSRSDKVIAHKVFDAALKRELHEVMQKAKKKANQIREPGDVWELERYLTQRRKGIDGKYDFRASQLARVLGRLLCERQSLRKNCAGLREDKLQAIHSCANVLSEAAA